MGAVALVSTALVGMTATVPPAHAVGCPSARDGSWSTYAAPAFSGWTDLTSAAVDPRDPAHLMVTNGTEVLRSLNGGCTWQPSPAAAALDTNAASTPSYLRFAQSQTGSRIYLVAGGTDQRIQVLVTADVGASWTATAPVELDAVYQPLIDVSGQSDRVAYLGVGYWTPQPVLYRTNDAQTWELRSEPAAYAGDSAARITSHADLEYRLHHPQNVSANAQLTVNTYNANGVLRLMPHDSPAYSADGGRTWQIYSALAPGDNESPYLAAAFGSDSRTRAVLLRGTPGAQPATCLLTRHRTADFASWSPARPLALRASDCASVSAFGVASRYSGSLGGFVVLARGGADLSDHTTRVYYLSGAGRLKLLGNVGEIGGNGFGAARVLMSQKPGARPSVFVTTPTALKQYVGTL